MIRRLGLAILPVVLVAAACTPTPDPAATASPEPQRDYATTMVACLSAKGWHVERGSDGGFGADIPGDQLDQYNADRHACREENGFNDEPEITPEMAGRFFDRLVAAAQCLRGLGYQVSDPPSKQSYVETLVNGELPDWAPYSELIEMGLSFAELEEADAACPQPTTW